MIRRITKEQYLKAFRSRVKKEKGAVFAYFKGADFYPVNEFGEGWYPYHSYFVYEGAFWVEVVEL